MTIQRQLGIAGGIHTKGQRDSDDVRLDADIALLADLPDDAAAHAVRLLPVLAKAITSTYDDQTHDCRPLPPPSNRCLRII